MHKARDVSFDIARSISALWVVGFWHLVCYDKSITVYNQIGQNITNIYMACFMFISGYMLSKYTFNYFTDVTVFFKKRFFRFYVLYVISAVTLFVFGKIIGSYMINDYGQLVLSLFGMTTLFPPHPGTLWFMSMLMLFYLVTPLISVRSQRYGTKGKILISIIIIFLFIIWGYFFHIDKMVYVYFPVYSLGLMISHKKIQKVKSTYWLLFPSISFIILLLSTPVLSEKNDLYRCVVMFSFVIIGTIFILIVSDFIHKYCGSFVNLFFKRIAYVSLAAYLFHRHIYSVLHSIIKFIGLEPNLLILFFLFLPIMLIVSYYIQSIYDKLILIFTKKNDGTSKTIC